MDKEETKILTRKHKNASHNETKVTIDWTGITTEQLKTLARRALIYSFQLKVTKDLIPGVPESWEILATEEAKDHTPIMVTVFAPKVEKCRDASRDLDIEALIERLSPEERAMLFAEVGV
jgi:hypothetical protein